MCIMWARVGFLLLEYDICRSRFDGHVMISPPTQQMNVPMNSCLGELWKILSIFGAKVATAQKNHFLPGQISRLWLYLRRLGWLRNSGSLLVFDVRKFQKKKKHWIWILRLAQLGWLDSVGLSQTQLDSVGLSQTQLDSVRLSQTQLDSVRLSQTCSLLVGSPNFGPGNPHRPKPRRTANVATSTLPAWAVPGSLSRAEHRKCEDIEIR